MLRRYGDPVRPGQRYTFRPGIYALIHRGDEVLLTFQAQPRAEFQFPGGGIDPGEHVRPALHREVLEETGWRYGGESSGHILCLDANTTGDGIVSALQVLLALRDTGTGLHEWQTRMSRMPQTMINVRRNKTVNLDDNTEIQAAVKATEKKLADRGRVLLRPSGTEPLVRVMVEGEDPVVTQLLAQELAEAVEKALS